MLHGFSKSRKCSGLSFLDGNTKWVGEIIPKVLSLKFNDDLKGKPGSLSSKVMSFFWEAIQSHVRHGQVCRVD